MPDHFGALCIKGLIYFLSTISVGKYLFKASNKDTAASHVFFLVGFVVDIDFDFGYRKFIFTMQRRN